MRAGLTARALKIHQIINAIFRFVIFDLGGEHDFRGFAYLTHNIGEGIIGHFALHIKLFRYVVVFQQIIGEFVVQIIIEEFTVGVRIDQIVFFGFQTDFVE